jgi:hypothetical protein
MRTPSPITVSLHLEDVALTRGHGRRFDNRPLLRMVDKRIQKQRDAGAHRVFNVQNVLSPERSLAQLES